MAASEPGESANRTAWHNADSPLRLFLRTETGSAAILLAAAIVALVWANADLSSYTRLWGTQFTLRLGDIAVSMDLQGWVNSGLMTFFFLVIGLEARREFDLGEFRDRRRFILPVIAGVGGMAGAIGLYLAINAGRSSAHGWGVAMSTDTAFALGVLALMGDRVPDRLRGFILTVTVVDDIVGLVVIAVVYSTGVTVPPLFVAMAVFAGVLVAVRLHVHNGLVYFALGATCWVAVFKSGIDPIVVGLAMGLVAYAAPVTRSDLERVSNLYRQFREQPTVELAQSARSGLRTALSPNDRLQRIYHPWASYLIVPLFGLANAGIPIDPHTLLRGYTSPITLGIVVGYVVGKPVGIALMSAAVVRVTKGRLRPPVGWAAIVGGGTIAGVGFTVSLLVATVAFRGVDLQEAKLGVLTAAVVSAVLTWSLFLVTTRSARPSARGLLGDRRSLWILPTTWTPNVTISGDRRTRR
jgi:Na+/H+ antiporter NhaA